MHPPSPGLRRAGMFTLPSGIEIELVELPACGRQRWACWVKGHRGWTSCTVADGRRHARGVGHERGSMMWVAHSEAPNGAKWNSPGRRHEPRERRSPGIMGLNP